MTVRVLLILLLLTVVAVVQARAYYDAIVIDAESRTNDGERPAVRRATFEDCLLPKISGHCRAFFQSYFYNMNTKKCDIFIYTGCGGNNNRFETLEECEKVCAVKKKEDLNVAGNKKCSLDAAQPPCNKGCRINLDSNNCPKCYCPKGKHQSLFREHSTRINREKNANRKPGRNHDSVCSLPEVRGYCRALLPRWRYDSDTSKCIEFKFGGCNGNGNNFMTEQQCMKTCGGFRIPA